MTPAGPNAFPPTRLSVIDRIRARDDDVRRAAFGEVVTTYWRPVYTHLRLTWRLTPEDAQDLTQGFFADAFEKTWLESYDPTKAKFRTFVRVCADRHVMNWRQAATRLKRGGADALARPDFDEAERTLHQHAAATADPDERFRQEFIRAVFSRALDAVRVECEARGHPLDFALFERYDVDPVEGVSYARLAGELGLTVTQVTNRLAHVRRLFREHALGALRALSGSEAHYREEARDVFGLEV